MCQILNCCWATSSIYRAMFKKVGFFLPLLLTFGKFHREVPQNRVQSKAIFAILQNMRREIGCISRTVRRIFRFASSK